MTEIRLRLHGPRYGMYGPSGGFALYILEACAINSGNREGPVITQQFSLADFELVPVGDEDIPREAVAKFRDETHRAVVAVLGRALAERFREIFPTIDELRAALPRLSEEADRRAMAKALARRIRKVVKR